MRRLLSLLLLMGAPAALSADAIDDYLAAEMTRRKIPGLGLAIARDGAIETRSYGIAHVETGSPVTTDSIFAIASLDKQLTAAGVLEAAEQGKLGLDDPIGKWVDVDLPGVTLRHLLSHTSGLPDEVAGTIEGRAFTDYSSEQLLATVSGLVPVAPPGARFLYSDAGLFLAQLATEKATGEPWWEFMRRELFLPAAASSLRSMPPGALIPNRVSAYTLAGAGALVRDRRLDIDYGPLYSDVGATAGDFARWLAALDRAAPLAPASVAQLSTPVRLTDGSAASELFQWSRYGLGVGLDDFLGEPIVLHSGHSGVGFVRFPVRKLAIVVFTNLEHPVGSDPIGLALGVAGLLEPALALASLPGRAFEGNAGSRLHATFLGLLEGRVDEEAWSPRMRVTAWEGAGGLAGRAPRLGALTRFELVEARVVDGEPTLLARAVHESGTLYLRFSFDADERISRLVWWHL